MFVYLEGILCGPLHTPEAVQAYENAIKAAQEQVSLQILTLLNFKNIVCIMSRTSVISFFSQRGFCRDF